MKPQELLGPPALGPLSTPSKNDQPGDVMCTLCAELYACAVVVLKSQRVQVPVISFWRWGAYSSSIPWNGTQPHHSRGMVTARN